MPACLIVCNRSYSFSLQLLFKQNIAWLYQRKLILTIAVFGCFTMKWVLWPNAPIIGGWAVLFTPRKYIFLNSFVEFSSEDSSPQFNRRGRWPQANNCQLLNILRSTFPPHFQQNEAALESFAREKINIKQEHCWKPLRERERDQLLSRSRCWLLDCAHLSLTRLAPSFSS